MNHRLKIISACVPRESKEGPFGPSYEYHPSWSELILPPAVNVAVKGPENDYSHRSGGCSLRSKLVGRAGLEPATR